MIGKTNKNIDLVPTSCYGARTVERLSRASTAERRTRSRPREELCVSRYFFHVYDDVVAQDEEGRELPSFEAARLEALRGARALIGEQVKHGYIVLSHWIDVHDEADEKLLTLRFGEAIDIRQ